MDATCQSWGMIVLWLHQYKIKNMQINTHSKVHVSKYLPSGTRFVAAGNVADFIGSMSAALRRGGEHSYLGIFGVYMYIINISGKMK